MLKAWTRQRKNCYSDLKQQNERSKKDILAMACLFWRCSPKVSIKKNRLNWYLPQCNLRTSYFIKITKFYFPPSHFAISPCFFVNHNILQKAFLVQAYRYWPLILLFELLWKGEKLILLNSYYKKILMQHHFYVNYGTIKCNLEKIKRYK